MDNRENALITNRHVLFCLNDGNKYADEILNEYEYLKNNFCGIVITDTNKINIS